MDFINRSGPVRPNGNAPQRPAMAGAPNTNRAVEDKRDKQKHRPAWFRWTFLVLLYSATILAVASLAYIAFVTPNPESRFVNKSELQAVFVNVDGTSGGQVYFGHITDLTNNYIRLTNVFYIQNQDSSTSNSSSSNANSYNLVKLGCELHGPEDAMVINRDQVFFWENLKSSGQVSQKVAEYYKENPNGQNCSTSNSSGSTSQGTSSTSTSTSTGSTSTGTSSTGTGTSDSSTSNSSTTKK